GNHPCNHC
ncbi:hypothetical protein D049_1286B, partial [Vibrio parahaemolyticus VPTS-2010]